LGDKEFRDALERNRREALVALGLGGVPPTCHELEPGELEAA
jgi:hypothetical protein